MDAALPTLRAGDAPLCKRSVSRAIWRSVGLRTLLWLCARGFLASLDFGVLPTNHVTGPTPRWAKSEPTTGSTLSARAGARRKSGPPGRTSSTRVGLSSYGKISPFERRSALRLGKAAAPVAALFLVFSLWISILRRIPFYTLNTFLSNDWS